MKIPSCNTALITGASAGLGREIAGILAGQGWNLVLTARSTQKLATLQAELTGKYGVSVHCVSTDLSVSGGAAAVHEYCTQNCLKIGLLVNNAGAGLCGESTSLGCAVTPVLNLNIIALTELCVLFGKDMKVRSEGLILNIGSVAGNHPTAFFASYAASKSYVLNYSLALRQELAPYGVGVTCVQPGYICTSFDDGCGITSEKYKRFSTTNGMKAEAVAKISVHAVLRNKPYVVAGFINKCAAFFSRLVPRNLLAKLLAKSVRSLLS